MEKYTDIDFSKFILEKELNYSVLTLVNINNEDKLLISCFPKNFCAIVSGDIKILHSYANKTYLGDNYEDYEGEREDFYFDNYSNYAFCDKLLPLGTNLILGTRKHKEDGFSIFSCKNITEIKEISENELEKLELMTENDQIKQIDTRYINLVYDYCEKRAEYYKNNDDKIVPLTQNFIYNVINLGKNLKITYHNDNYYIFKQNEKIIVQDDENKTRSFDSFDLFLDNFMLNKIFVTDCKNIEDFNLIDNLM